MCQQRIYTVGGKMGGGIDVILSDKGEEEEQSQMDG